MNVIKTAIQQPITVTVGIILTLLAGVVALDRIPIQMAPDIEDTVIAVTTTWENASPQEVEAEVIDEQEEKLQGVTGLVSMTSTSRRGQGQIRLQFRTGTRKDDALREVNSKLREVPSYPENVDEPVIEDSDPESQDYIAWFVIACTDPSFDITTLYDFLDKRVKPRFERLPGVSEVGLLGGREREVQIRVNPERLAQRGIPISQLVTRLRAENDDYSGGAVPDGKNDIRIRALGRFGSIEATESTVLAQSAAGPVTLGDVATVVETYKEAKDFVRSRGVPVMAFNFKRELGANVLEVMREIRAETARLNEAGGLLDFKARQLGINGKFEVVQVYDQTLYIDQAIELVRDNILLGAVLAVVALLLFLRSPRAVAIIGIAIPISGIGTVVMLVALGRTINVISLAGIAFAVGMVVDNSIVVLENIFRHQEMGKARFKACLDGTTEVAGAVLASTLTTLIVFFPVLLIEQAAGQLFRDIALAIMSAVGISYVASITVIPSAGALLLSKTVKRPDERAEPQGRLARMGAWAGRFPEFTGRAVGTIAAGLIRRVVVIVAFAVLTIGGIILLMPPIDYLPKGNRNIVFGLLIPPPGYNLDQMTKVGLRIESRMRPAWMASPPSFEAESAYNAVNGSDQLEDPQPPEVPVGPFPGAPMIRPPALENYFLVVTGGQMFHGGSSSIPYRALDLQPLFQYATDPEAAPGIIAFAFQMPLFRTAGSTGQAIKVDLSGPDLDHVTTSTLALFGKFAQTYGPYATQPEPSNFNIPSPELQVTPEKRRLADLGLGMTDLGVALQAAADGAFIGEYQLGEELVDLKLIFDEAVNRQSLEGMRDVPLATPMGKVVTLDEVARFTRAAEPDLIKRVGRQRAVTLQLTAPEGVPLEEVIAQVEGMVQELRGAGAISEDVQVDLAGSASKLAEIKTALLGNGSLAGTITSSLFLALLVVYLLMCVLFQSWSYPLVIILTVPLATLGGFGALSMLHAYTQVSRYDPVQNLDVLTILGFVILAGVVVNNAILIVYQALDLKRGVDGEAPLPSAEAISKAVETRVRPIMMSTITSVGGMLPLVLVPGSGSELYRGLGAVVTGGLIVSTVFTLVLIPVVLSLLFDLQDKAGAALGEEEG